MKTEELIELSKRVAEKLGIKACIDGEDEGQFGGYQIKRWLHEDSARCFELMCEHSLAVNVAYGVGGDICVEVTHCEHEAPGRAEYFSSFDANKSLATRVAILRAIEGM